MAVRHFSLYPHVRLSDCWADTRTYCPGAACSEIGTLSKRLCLTRSRRRGPRSFPIEPYLNPGLQTGPDARYRSLNVPAYETPSRFAAPARVRVE